MKSLTVANEDKQLRLGLGQVLRYRHLLGLRGTRAAAVLVAEHEPMDATWTAPCEAHGVMLVWPAVFDRLR